jgi:two-component system, LuxR family, sensor kinase FixL
VDAVHAELLPDHKVIAVQRLAAGRQTVRTENVMGSGDTKSTPSQATEAARASGEEGQGSREAAVTAREASVTDREAAILGREDVASLREKALRAREEAARTRAELEVLTERLQDANEHLVVANLRAQTLAEDAQQLAAIVESSDDAIIGKTLDGIVTNWNPGAERLYGYSAAEMIGRPISVLAPTDRPDEMPGLLEALKRGEAIRDYETERVTKAAQRVDVSIKISPIRDASGSLIGASTIARDIGDRKRAEKKLRDLLEAAPDAMVIVDDVGHIVLVNAEVERLFGYQRDDLLGCPVEMLLPERYRSVHVSHRRDYAQDAHTRPMGAGLELYAVRKDGSEVPVEISLSPLDTEEGPLVVTAIRDISERKRTEQQVAAANEQLRKAEAERVHIARVVTSGELASSIAHEINQPLAAIVNDGAACLRWLQGRPPKLDEARESVRHMIADAIRASHVIARVRSLLAKKPSVKAPFDPNDLVRETAALVKGEIARFGATIRTKLTPDLPDVLGDRIQVQQVLLNLIVNALEAMSSVDDRPRELALRSSRGGSSAVLLAVRDSGVGIAPDLRDRIFEPFYTTKADGLGMGLAICRSIVEGHSGHLWAVEHEGPGLTVQFTLPIADEEA